MAYQQVNTVLTHVETFHHEAAEFYDRLAADCGAPRTVMLLEYLGKHERLLEKAIVETRSNLSDRVSKTWITTTDATVRLTEAIEEAPIPSHNLTTDDVLELGMKLNERVISVYEELVDRDAPTWVTEVFQNLLEMEQQQERHMVTQASRGVEL